MGLHSPLCNHFPFGLTVTNSTENYRERSELALVSPESAALIAYQGGLALVVASHLQTTLEYLTDSKQT